MAGLEALAKGALGWKYFVGAFRPILVATNAMERQLRGPSCGYDSEHGKQAYDAGRLQRK